MDGSHREFRRRVERSHGEFKWRMDRSHGDFTRRMDRIHEDTRRQMDGSLRRKEERRVAEIEGRLTQEWTRHTGLEGVGGWVTLCLENLRVHGLYLHCIWGIKKEQKIVAPVGFFRGPVGRPNPVTAHAVFIVAPVLLGCFPIHRLGCSGEL